MGSVRSRLAMGVATMGLLTLGAIAAIFAGFIVIAIILMVGLLGMAAWTGLTLVRVCERGELALTLAQNEMAEMHSQMRCLLETYAQPAAVIDPNGHIELANSAATVRGLADGMDVMEFSNWLRGLQEAAADSKAVSVRHPSRDGPLSSDGRASMFVPRIMPIVNASGASHGVILVLGEAVAINGNSARSKAISNLSHDLKTPMTSIQMSIHLLLEDAAPRLTARQLEFLQAARDDACRLQTFIEEMVATVRGGV